MGRAMFKKEDATSPPKTRVPAARSWSELQSQFQQICDRASKIMSGVEPAVLLRHPKPECWSAADCLAHLNLSVDPYFPLWAQSFQRASRLEQDQRNSHRLDFWGRILVWALEPPPRFRFPTSANFKPLITGPAEQILADFLQRQQRILETLKSAGGFDVDRIKIASPFDARVRYSIWSSFCVTAAHERRHLGQAERALSE